MFDDMDIDIGSDIDMYDMSEQFIEMAILADADMALNSNLEEERKSEENIEPRTAREVIEDIKARMKDATNSKDEIIGLLQEGYAGLSADPVLREEELSYLVKIMYDIRGSGQNENFADNTVEVLGEDTEIEVELVDDFAEVLVEDTKELSDDTVEILGDDTRNLADNTVEVLGEDTEIEVERADYFAEVLVEDTEIEVERADDFAEVLVEDTEIEVELADDFAEVLVEDTEIEVELADDFAEVLGEDTKELSDDTVEILGDDTRNLADNAVEVLGEDKNEKSSKNNSSQQGLIDRAIMDRMLNFR